jgi:hypothetical protein
MDIGGERKVKGDAKAWVWWTRGWNYLPDKRSQSGIMSAQHKSASSLKPWNSLLSAFPSQSFTPFSLFAFLLLLFLLLLFDGSLSPLLVTKNYTSSDAQDLSLLPLCVPSYLEAPALTSKQKTSKTQPDTMVHTCNPTLEEETSRIMVQGQPRQKVQETPSEPRARHGGTHLSSPAVQ